MAIRNSIGDRPIYFASSGAAPYELGVRPYVIRQGLAFRLWPGDPAELADSAVMANRAVDRDAIAEYRARADAWARLGGEVD